MDNNRNSEVIFYQTQDGATRIEVKFENETVWLTQVQLAELFQTTRQNVGIHIKNLYEEGELAQEATIKKSFIVQNEGERKVSREQTYYNLDVIISVGYRVKSHRGTQFRIWATQRIKEYLIKGFSLDDVRLKKVGGGGYFDELLSRIRDIRSSEKVFWRKVLEIYATSIDYSPATEASKDFFKTVQNKMHWAVHGQTAAEVIASRANASKPNMGLTHWLGSKPSREDIEIAKNYLNPEELDALNRLVTMYLDFAELQAKNRKPMHMKDWIEKLDSFLNFNEREVLSHAGKISHKQAVKKAHNEYDKFHALQSEDLSLVEQDFVDSLNKAVSEIKV